MPTLLDRGSFSYDSRAVLVGDQLHQAETERAIDIIVNILRTKLRAPGRNNRIYYLRGRTGSGKSTLMISSLYERVTKGTNGGLWCTEPRVVLTRSNPTDIIRYNPQYKFGRDIGILSGHEKIKCDQRESVYFCTPQILNDELLNILSIKSLGDARRALSKIRLIVVDEVHVLDNPMLQLLKTIRDVIDKYDSYTECPLFIFASATINIEKLVEYYHTNPELVYRDPLMIGEVKGSSNFPVSEQFLDNNLLKQYNKQEAESNNRLEGFKIMTEYFINNFLDNIDKHNNEHSYINTYAGAVKCRDVLFFIPLVSGIEEIGNILKQSVKDIPIMIIEKGMEFDVVKEWRDKLKGKKRILFIPFARDYSPASDILLAEPLEKDKDSLLNEIRIIAATPVIETGKTISTLRLCIDMGLNTTTIANPLSYNPNDSMKYLKQVPANVNQTIQRMGRVGREAEGEYLHFYSKDVYKHFQLTDTAETINTQCLSTMMMSHLTLNRKNKCYDIINENVWLYPTTIDVLIRTTNDLIQAGYLLPYGQYVELRSNSKYSSNWLMYAKILHVKYNMSLFDSLLISAINWKAIPGLFNINNVDPRKLRYSIISILDRFKKVVTEDDYFEYIANLPDEVYEGIYKARNALTEILYSKDKSFPVDLGRIY